MTCEWKPGDVAAWQYISAGTGRAHEQETALRVPSCSTNHHSPGAHWHLGNGGWTQHDDYIRPLVVIDPEDSEQVERLALAYKATWRGMTSDVFTVDILVRQLGEALREFADPKPPKPDEPSGLGAVVEDAQGDLWVRNPDPDVYCKWRNRKQQWRNWSALDVVRVLSEGVQP